MHTCVCASIYRCMYTGKWPSPHVHQICGELLIYKWMHTCVCASINRCMYTRFVVSCLYINGYICMHTCVCASINRCMCIGKSSSPHVHQMWYVSYTHCMCACVCMHTSISNIRPRPTRGQFVNEA